MIRMNKVGLHDKVVAVMKSRLRYLEEYQILGYAGFRFDWYIVVNITIKGAQ